jgi:thiamine transport system ATP-binding protein
VLEVRDVTVRFGPRTILERAGLSIGDGEVVALLGPSGSGKSTLLRVIAGLLQPDAGRVIVDGVDVSQMPTHRRNVGLVFQDEQLFPHRTVGQNVEFGLRMQGRPPGSRRARVAEMLDLVGLTEFTDRGVTDLSGGEAKRVALARTLAPAPRVVLLDEPLTGLDRDLHDQLAVELRRVLHVAGATALLVTHGRDEADVVADRRIDISELRG